MALTHPSWTVDTTFSSKNIATAASVYTFTAAAAAKVKITVKLTNAAGNGDYVIYLQHQWLGTGTAAVVLPKTTCPAAAGVAVIQFMSMELDVKATDVIDVYIDGLAGDTSVNGAIRISADNPSVFDQASDVPAVNVTMVKGLPAPDLSGLDGLDGSTLALEATAQAILLDTGTTLPGLIEAAGGSGTYSYSNTVDDGSGNLLDGVFVELATDTAFTNIVSTTHTNSLGAFTVYSDVAGTHYLRLTIGSHQTGTETVTLA